MFDAAGGAATGAGGDGEIATEAGSALESSCLPRLLRSREGLGALTTAPDRVMMAMTG